MKHTFIAFVLFLNLKVLVYSQEQTYQTMVDLCATLSDKHPSVRSAQALVRSAKDQVSVSLGVYYPDLNLSIDQSFTKLENHNSTDPSQEQRDVSASISQLIYDFGKSTIDIKIAFEEVRRREYELESAKQNILIEGLEVCLDYSNTWQQIDFEAQSADNFKRQMDLEATKVQKGQGYSTDVLQAEAQWLGAKNRQLQLEAELQRHKHNFEALFGTQVSVDVLNGELIRKVDLEFPSEFQNASSSNTLNTTSANLNLEVLTHANSALKLNTTNPISSLIHQNPLLLSLKTAIEIQHLRRSALKRNRFSPQLSSVLASELNQTDSRTNPFQRETSASLQLNFPFNLGFTSLDEISALSERIYSLQQDYENEQRNLLKALKDHLVNWNVALQSRALLERQVLISRKFLDGAEKERTMGRRSLIDVINGELILIRAKSSLEQAEIQALRSYFRYLSTIGILSPSKL